MRKINIALTAASFSGNKGAYAMLQSCIQHLHKIYGDRLRIRLMSVYPRSDKEQLPFHFINVVSCKPELLLFVAFPLAVAYWLFRWLPPARTLIEKCSPVIRAYRKTDLTIDLAGISFVDSRGWIMNIYAFVCAAVPLLIGVPVVKYSQALGSFKSPLNRFLAKWILPKLSLICARGQITYDNLLDIGIRDNVSLCADGAFIMEDDEAMKEQVNSVCVADHFFNGNVIAFSLSAVVEQKCRKDGIDYASIMVSFIKQLLLEGYHVLILANAARMNSEKLRNNDLPICRKVYSMLDDHEHTRWYDKEMTAEEIREYIAHSRFLIGSRFHAMIGALTKKVPTFLIGWSHKYQEILNMFELGQYASDFSELSLESLSSKFHKFVQHEEEIRQKIDKHLEAVQESSYQNIHLISRVIDEIIAKPSKSLLNLNDTEHYMGSYLDCRMGYAPDENIRRHCSSGGSVTALLCYMLENGDIDGAWVCKTTVRDGKLGYETKIATTTKEIIECASSVYMALPLLKHLSMLKSFSGKIAVVLLPCQMRAFNNILEEDTTLKEKIVLKIALYCSACESEQATLMPLRKAGVTLKNAQRVVYRNGYWRGNTIINYADGSQKMAPYVKTICAYKNAYFFSKKNCLLCQDQFGFESDLSCGDIWLKRMKKLPIKHTACILRSEKAQRYYWEAVNSGRLTDAPLSAEDVVRSQKRALVFKFNCAAAKVSFFKKKGIEILLDTKSPCKWNHRFAYRLALFNQCFAEQHFKLLDRIPNYIVYCYMLFIRALLSF